MPPKATTKEWKGTYLGSTVAIPGEPPEAAVPRIKRYASKRKDEDGKGVPVRVEVTDSEFRTYWKKEVLQAFELDAVVYAARARDSNGRKDENLILITSLSHDKRLSIRLTHLFFIDKKGFELPRHVHYNFNLSGKKAQNENIPKGTQIFSSLYLGYNLIVDSPGEDAIEKSYLQNKVIRETMKSERKGKKQIRATIESAFRQHENTGSIVEEHNVTLVMTSKSIRVVDSTTGETLTKFVTSTVEKTAIVGEEKVLGVLTNDTRINNIACFLLIPEYNGEEIREAITELAKKVLAEHKNLTERGPFTPAPNAPREAPPPELYKLQVHRADLEAEKVLGAGEFGEVYLAKQKCRSKSGNVIQVRRAVKTLKQGAGGNDKNEFLHEAMIMLAVGSHPNVVRMVGVAVQQAPWLCVLEFLPYGDMLGVLAKLKEQKISLEVAEFLFIGNQLAAGCGHLAKRRLVHMDLAARNILVSDNGVCKIADFGMTMPYSNMGDFVQLQIPIRMAVKWGAPEAVNNLLFSEKSDVWAWGVTMWEIFSYGTMPWKGETNNSTMVKIMRGKRLSKPKRCPPEVFQTLMQTWDIMPAKRPQFHKIQLAFQALEHRFPSKNGIRDIGALAKGKKGKGGDDEEPEDLQTEDLSVEEGHKIAVSASNQYQLLPSGGGGDGDDVYGWGGMGEDDDEDEDDEDPTSMYSGGLRRRSTMTKAVAIFAGSSRRGRRTSESVLTEDAQYGIVQPMAPVVGDKPSAHMRSSGIYTHNVIQEEEKQEKQEKQPKAKKSKKKKKSVTTTEAPEGFGFGAVSDRPSTETKARKSSSGGDTTQKTSTNKKKKSSTGGSTTKKKSSTGGGDSGTKKKKKKSETMPPKNSPNKGGIVPPAGFDGC
eukprot:m.24012 g.24012  ORF g.24012 m.24012 type:complete len:877 (+) comp7565_c0_seq1:238-2868(+)